MKPLEHHRTKATQVFDLWDAFAHTRRIHGSHPKPFGQIKFYAVAQITDGDVRKNFNQPLEMLTKLSPSGYHLFFGDFGLHDHSNRINILDEGQLAIYVAAQYYQPIERTDVIIPMPDPHNPISIDLQPGYAYPFPRLPVHHLTLLYGKVQNANKDGLANVTVTDQAETIHYWTDQSGQWVLIFPDDWETGTVNLNFTLPDGLSQTLDDIEVEQGQINSIPPVTLPG